MIKRFTRLAPLVAVAALALALFAPASAFATKSVGISAPSFDFNVKAGQAEKGEIVLLNEGTEKIQVMVYAADQKTNASGTVTYVAPTHENGAIGQGPASWLQLTLPEGAKTMGNTPYVELGPGERMPVKFNFTVPEGVSPGDHQAVIFFEMFDTTTNQKGSVTRVSGRIGSRLRIRVNGAFIEKLEVAPFAVRNFVIGDKIPWSFTLSNTGNLDESTAVDLRILDANEAEVLRSNVITDAVAYASTSVKRNGVLQSDKLGLGSYTVRLTASYKKQGAAQPETVTKERSVFVVPLWVVYLLIAIVALLLIGLIVLAGRGRKKRKAAAAAAAAAAIVPPAAPAAEAEQRKAE